MVGGLVWRGLGRTYRLLEERGFRRRDELDWRDGKKMRREGGKEEGRGRNQLPPFFLELSSLFLQPSSAFRSPRRLTAI